MQPRSNKRKIFCVITGGYGRVPVEERLLSPDSLARFKKDGPCLTIAQVPTLDSHTGNVVFEMVKIFSQPIKHPRETVPFNINLIYPSNPSFAKQKPGT